MAKTKKQFNLRPIGTDQPEADGYAASDLMPDGRQAQANDPAQTGLAPGRDTSEPDLSEAERQELAIHEQVIEAGLDVFLSVGIALASIQQKKLYRQQHDTFEAYCNSRYDLTSRRAYQLIRAATVVQSLSIDTVTRHPAGDEPARLPRAITILPKTEAHAAALDQIAPDKRAGVWNRVVARSQETGKAITARQIRQTYQQLYPEPDSEPESIPAQEIGGTSWLDPAPGSSQPPAAGHEKDYLPYRPYLDYDPEQSSAGELIQQAEPEHKDAEESDYTVDGGLGEQTGQVYPGDAGDPARLDSLREGVDALAKLFDREWTEETIGPLITRIPGVAPAWRTYVESSGFTYDAWWGCWSSFTPDLKDELIGYALATAAD